ncbi:MAG: hypothetical protein B0D92_02855 [Spirochaeta sp. LUC14_002_19_P3]|nr:MAG: hypothetical protein B0D92_02855 [Spirochaeta sp. LUC14_002_19_P3]
MENGNKSSEVIGIGEWLIVMLLSVIPVVNIIMWLVWAFGGGTHPSKANWAKAQFIWIIVVGLMAILFWGSIATLAAVIANI